MRGRTTLWQLSTAVALIALGVVLATAPRVWSQALNQPLNAPTQVYTPLGYQQVTVTASAFTLPAIPAGTRLAVICTEAQGLRWRDDGVAPTATVGMLIASGGCVTYSGAQLAVIQFIAATAGAIADVSYYR